MDVQRTPERFGAESERFNLSKVQLSLKMSQKKLPGEAVSGRGHCDRAERETTNIETR